MRLVATLVIVGIHGITVASVAVVLGDAGPKYDGRRTLNPLAHLDLLGGLGMLLFSLGWIKPIAVNPDGLSHSRRDLVLIVLAGSASVLLLVLLLQLVAPVVVTTMRGTGAFTAYSFITTTSVLAIWFALFNLIPLPPLTGHYLLIAAAPGWRGRFDRYPQFWAILWALLIVTGVVVKLLEPVQRVLARLLLGS